MNRLQGNSERRVVVATRPRSRLDIQIQDPLVVVMMMVSAYDGSTLGLRSTLQWSWRDTPSLGGLQVPMLAHTMNLGQRDAKPLRSDL